MNTKGKTSTLARSKKRKKAALIITAFFAAGLVIYGVLLPSEDKEIDQIKDALRSLTDDEITQNPMGMMKLVDGKNKSMSKEELDKIKNMIKDLSPKTRKIITKEIMKERLKKIRDKTANLPQSEKEAMVKKIVDKIREKFKNMNQDSRDSLKDRMDSEKGKEEAKEALDSYYNDFTSQERQTYDPIVNEYLNNINAL